MSHELIKGSLGPVNTYCHKIIATIEKSPPMRKLAQHSVLLFLLLLTLSSPALAEKPAPNFTLPVLPGNTEITLSSLEGRVVYLDFWATWCPPCRKSFPWMDEMQERFSDEGLTIIAISIDSQRELAERFMQQMEPRFIVAHDASGAVSSKYRVTAMPTSYLIDRNGNIVNRHIGFRKSDTDRLEREIEDLLDR